jgi:hypothetical protein
VVEGDALGAGEGDAGHEALEDEHEALEDEHEALEDQHEASSSSS